jgi:serine/threonine-protein kinase
VSDRLTWASPQLDSVIAKALAKSPAVRYPTAGDFAAAASAALTLPLPSAPAAPPVDRDEPPPHTELGGAESHGAAADFISLLPHTRAVSQRRQLLVAIAVAGVLIIALSVWLIGRSPGPPGTAPTAAPPTTSTAPPAALEDLRRLLPAGYPAEACTPAPSPDGATVITCGPNTDPGGPRSATYTLAAGPEALRTTFDQLVESTTVVVCPGNIQSPARGDVTTPPPSPAEPCCAG